MSQPPPMNLLCCCKSSEGQTAPPLPSSFPLFKRASKDTFQGRKSSLSTFPSPPPSTTLSALGRPGCVCDPRSTRDCSGTCRRSAYSQFPIRPHLALVEVRTASAPSFLSISSCLLFPFSFTKLPSYSPNSS